MKLPLSLVLTVGLAGLQFIAITTILTSSFVTSERTLLNHASGLMRDVADNTLAHSRGFLTPGEGAAELATRLAENQIVSSENTWLLEKLLFQQLQLTPQFSGIFYGSESGGFVYVMRTGKETAEFRTKIIRMEGGAREVELIYRNADFSIASREMDPTDTYDPRVRPWYKRAKESAATIWTDPYIFFTSQQPGITVASPVSDLQGNHIGAIGVDIQISSISEFLAGLSVGTSGRAIILNQNEDVIAHPNPDLIVQEQRDGGFRFSTIREIQDPLARAAFETLSAADLITNKTGATAEFRHAGEKYLTTTATRANTDLPWTIIVIAREWDFIGAMQRDRSFNSYLALAIAVLTGITGLLIARSINRPIKALAERATEISQGNYQLQGDFPATYHELEQANETMTREAERRKMFEDQYSLMFDRGARGMAEISPSNGRLRRVNKRFAEILGYSEDALLDMKVNDILQLAQKEAEVSLFAGDGIPREQQIRRADHAQIWISVNTLVLAEEEDRPHHIVLIIDDISEAKAKDAQLRALSRDLTHNARLDTMGQMAAGLAHELNQPLTAITQNAESALFCVRDGDAPNAELEEILRETETHAFRAAEIIRALRGFMRKDEGAYESFEIAPLIAQTIGLVAAEAREQNVHILQSHKPLAPITASRVQVAQVLVNLLRNAIDALSTKETGLRRIQITTRPASGGGVQVDVEDNGPGVDEEINLFERFETTKTTGMGLGLSICRTIIEQHGGKLWYDAEARGGSFHFTLPGGQNE